MRRNSRFLSRSENTWRCLYETNNGLAVIENSSELQSQWAKYQKKFPYAKDITYQETVNAVKEVIHEVYF